MLIREAIVDERLPQLGELLDMSRMRELFERELIAARGLAGAYSVESCRIIHVKYRPGKGCLISYALKVAELSTGRATGQGREQVLNLLACVEGESIARFMDAKRQRLVPCGLAALGIGLLHLPLLESVVWLFPNDRKLVGLPAVVDSTEAGHGILSEVAACSYGEECMIVESERDVIRYAAERACTVRVRLRLRNSRTADVRPLLLFGKTYSLDEGALAWMGLRHLWSSDARRRGRLSIPRPLVYQSEIKTVWQEGLGGKTLAECDPESPHFRESVAKAGAAVAALHRIQGAFAPPATIGMVVLKLEAAVNLLSRFRPSAGEKLGSLFDLLAASAGRIGERPAAALHGDLHMKNFLITGDRVALIDLDNLCQGDPLQDVGSFVAALHYQGLLEGRPSHLIEQTAQRFIESYHMNAGGGIAESALDWHTAAALIYERAYRCVTRLKEIRVEILDDIIELASRFSMRI